MEEQFILKRYCKFSVFEQHFMSAEERAWQIARMNKENKRMNQRGSTAPPGTQNRAMPPERKS
jgi:hypothetical protein